MPAEHSLWDLYRPSLLLARNARDSSAASTQTTSCLAISMLESAKQGEEPVIGSKKPEGTTTLNPGSTCMLFVPKILFDSLPLKYAGNLRNSWEGNIRGPAYSLFDKFKRKKKDPIGANRKQQWVPMMGTPHGLCRASKLSVKFNRCYAACIPKHNRRSQGNTEGFCGEQPNMCIQDETLVPGLFCIGVEDVTYSGTDFVRDGKTSDPPLPQNKNNLEMPMKLYTLPSGSVKLSVDAAKIYCEGGFSMLSKLDLTGQYHPSSSAILSSSSSSYPPHFQSADDPSIITDKSEQHSPVSVLEKLFEEASARPAISCTTQPIKPPPIQPLHINFDEPSPVKFHSATIHRYKIPSKKHTWGAAEYTRKVLAASGLDWYQLALKLHCSTGQMLDPTIYTKVESESPLDTRLLFDHINEVLLDIYKPYYPWVPLNRPNNTQHIVVERKLVDEVLDNVERNLLHLTEQQTPIQKLVVSAMEKCGTWMDICRGIEEMVLEMVEEIEEEVVEEFVFELWIEDD